MKRKANDAAAPSPEQLAAYLDGELDALGRARVAAWLCGHPAAAAELEALRRLERVWHENTPPAPDEAQWDALLGRIVADAERRTAAVAAEEPVVASGPARVLRPAHTGWRWHLRMAGTAAALLFVILAAYRPSPLSPPAPTPPSIGPAVVHVLRVADDDDVEIVSMDAADIGSLVVGEPPMRGPFVLAAPGDVILESIAPDPQDGMTPPLNNMEMNSPNGPMILAPLTVAINR
jgi:hypothetical protein